MIHAVQRGHKKLKQPAGQFIHPSYEANELRDSHKEVWTIQ